MSQRDTDRSGGALFADPGQDGLIHRGFLRGQGFSAQDVRRSPVIGICSSWSELNPCNAGLHTLAAAVKRGVADAGGLALEFPTISLSEPFVRPTSLYLRNLMAMDVEEMIASSPVDGIVLLGGCDKTVPAQLMGALSAGKPAVMVTAGPRPVSCWKGADFTIDDLWPLMDARRVGDLSDTDWVQLEETLNTGVGTCNVLGTAVTMAAVAEVLGFALPHSTLVAAADPRREAGAEMAGQAAVAAVRHARLPSDLVTLRSLENAFRVVCAIGGSTNTLIHLEAIAGRVGITIGPQRLRAWARSTPLLADVKPSGHHLLEALEQAGGIARVMTELADVLDLSCRSGTGESWGSVLACTPRAPDSASSVVHPMQAPLATQGGLTILTGSLAPRGAVLKSGGQEPAAPRRGRALVFDGVADLNSRIDDDDLDVDPDSVLILRGMGVRGGSGMPEVGHIPIPAKLVRTGVTDMLRVTDARMSGTAVGTVVLHVTPEAAAGGPLGKVRDGDVIELNVATGSINLLVREDELSARPAYPGPPAEPRGYGWLHARHVLQPDLGCDFDFLRADFVDNIGRSGDAGGISGA